MQVTKLQRICQWAQVEPMEPAHGTKLGLALCTLGKLPINGLRHPPTDTTNGWYIWCGNEMSTSTDFFSPLHIEHISEYLPEAAEYLALPPGYRFLIDGQDFEDVWFDPHLLVMPTSV